MLYLIQIDVPRLDGQSATYIGVRLESLKLYHAVMICFKNDDTVRDFSSLV